MIKEKIHYRVLEYDTAVNDKVFEETITITNDLETARSFVVTRKMFKNKKMQRVIILIILVLLACSCNKKKHEVQNIKNAAGTIQLNIDKKGYAIRLFNNELIIKNSDSAEIYKSGKLIRNFDLLNTTLFKGTHNDFFLIYQNNASSTKTQTSFHLYCDKNDLLLISKEQVGLNSENLFVTKNYFTPFSVVSMDYETLDQKTDMDAGQNSIISKTKFKENILFNNIKTFETVFNYKSKEDFFTDYPVNILKIGKINLINIENSNDIAFYLSEATLYDEAIIILGEIIHSVPTRTVAYLNIADSYWAIGNKLKAKDNYLRYIELMKSQNKDMTKIPDRVYHRSS